MQQQSEIVFSIKMIALPNEESKMAKLYYAIS